MFLFGPVHESVCKLHVSLDEVSVFVGMVAVLMEHMRLLVMFMLVHWRGKCISKD